MTTIILFSDRIEEEMNKGFTEYTRYINKSIRSVFNVVKSVNYYLGAMKLALRSWDAARTRIYKLVQTDDNRPVTGTDETHMFDL